MPRVCWEEQLCVSCEFVTINSRCTDFLRSTRPLSPPESPFAAIRLAPLGLNTFTGRHPIMSGREMALCFIFEEGTTEARS
jgi:hypothetical protein